MTDVTFTCMGAEMRLYAEGGDVAAVQRLLHHVDARLSRFRPDSELSRLNADPRATVPASSLLRTAVSAALWAAERSGGLVDPTLLEDLERAGYVKSMAGRAAAGRAKPTGPAPGARTPARARGDRRWRLVRVDDDAGTITRPPGLRLDTAGTTKGLAADLAAELLADAPRFFVDCAGDLRLGGDPGWDVVVEHPLTGEPAATLRDVRGAVATSGVARRAWHGPDGRPAHHLLDPATGAPAWTGLLSATALAPTTLAAETLAKVALLRGPFGARRALARSGGVLVHDDGRVERLAGRPVLRVSQDDLRRAA